MSHSTFGSSFAQTFQQSMAAAKQAADDVKREKRMNEKMMEQRAYNTRQDTEKEFMSLGGKRDLLAKFGPEHQHALDLELEDLRSQNKEGRRFAQGGGVRQPDSMLPEEQSSAYSKGFQDQQDTMASADAESALVTERLIKQSNALAENVKAQAGYKYGQELDPSISFDMGGDVTQQLANIKEQKDFDKKYVAAGGPPQFDGAKHTDAPSAADYGRLASLERSQGIVTSSAVAASQESARLKATSDLKLAEEHRIARDWAMEKPGSIPPEIPLGDAKGDPALARLYADYEKDKASQRHASQQFIEKALPLIPKWLHNRVMDSNGNITPTGMAFMWEHVKMQDYTKLDEATGKIVIAQRLEFTPPVDKPVGAGGLGGSPVNGTGGGAPIPAPQPQAGRPVYGPRGDGDSAREEDQYLRGSAVAPTKADTSTPEGYRFDMQNYSKNLFDGPAKSSNAPSIPSNVKDARDRERALDMWFRNNRY